MRKGYNIPPSARRQVNFGHIRYGPYKNNFEDGPYRVEASVSVRDPQPWVIYDKSGQTLVYVASERWSKELVEEWNLNHALWIMLKE